VVVPAHNEELVLASALESLRAQTYPAHLLEVVVVADNCTDTTAEIAREYDVTVWERSDSEQRGKGYALAWTIEVLLARSDPPDAVVIIDADTWVAPDFVALMADRLTALQEGEGCCALQGRYGVLNGTEGWRSALMSGAFELVNHIRPLGADRLGLNVSLKGNGMAFTREVLERARWQGHSITEDLDYSLDLLRNHRLRVRYVPEARVLAQMPVTSEQAASQRVRWEGGRYRLLRERALPLLLEGVRKRSLPLLDAGFALLLPPLAELAALLLLWSGLIAFGSRKSLLFEPGEFALLCALSLLGFVAYVCGGVRVAGVPPAVYAALFKAPFYIVWKLVLYASRFLHHRSDAAGSRSEWVRTARTPILPPAPEAGADSAAPKKLG
jgi:1,2-diacylglycerol 3-beta-glucosyltransferase